MGDNRLRRLRSQALAPVKRPKVKSEFVDTFRRFVGSQPAASRKILVNEKKNRPVLKLVRMHGVNFTRKPLSSGFI